MIGTVLACTFLVFCGLEWSIRGGFRTVIIPIGADPDGPEVRRLVDEFHLDDSIVIRYGHWLADVATGDFGRSSRGGVPVTEVLLHRLPITLELTLLAATFAIGLGVPLGLLAASRSDRGRGGVINPLLGMAQSTPVFMTPIFLIWLFAIRLQWLPAAGWTRISESLIGNLRGVLLPVTALVLAEIGIVARIIRADVIRTVREDYVTAAMAKGMSSRYVLFRHALRPASLGLLNVIGTNIGSLLSGAVIVEIIFGIGGLGQVLFEASLNRDLYLLLGLTTYTVVVYVALNALVDLAVFAADPRIRRS